MTQNVTTTSRDNRAAAPVEIILPTLTQSEIPSTPNHERSSLQQELASQQSHEPLDQTTDNDPNLGQEEITGDKLVNNSIQRASAALENNNPLAAAEALEKGVAAMTGQVSNTTTAQLSNMTPEQLKELILNNSMALAINQIQKGNFEDAIPALGLFFSTIINNYEVIKSLFGSVFSADAKVEEQPNEESALTTEHTQAHDALKTLNDLKETDHQLAAQLNTRNILNSQRNSFNEGIIALDLQLGVVQDEIVEIKGAIAQQQEKIKSQNTLLDSQFDRIAEIDRDINIEKKSEDQGELDQAKSFATNYKNDLDENERALVDLENSLRERQLAIAESQAHLARIKNELEANKRLVDDIDPEITNQRRRKQELSDSLCQFLNEAANKHLTLQSNGAGEASSRPLKNVA